MMDNTQPATPQPQVSQVSIPPSPPPLTSKKGQASRIILIIVAMVFVAVLSSLGTYWYLSNQSPSAKIKDSSLQTSVNETNQNTCTDSDGGQDHFINGVIKYREYDQAGSVTVTSDPSDDCVDTFIAGENKNVLREYYCDANKKVHYDYFDCPKGCSKGVCNKETQANYIPVKYLLGKPQKIGQTIKIAENIKVTGVMLKGSYGVGKSIQLSVYPFESRETIASGSALTTGSFDVNDIVKGKDFAVSFDKPITLTANKTYIFIIESIDDKTDAGIGFVEEDLHKEGEMYIFTRLIGGNGEILDYEHSWQPKKSQDVLLRPIKSN